MKWRGATEDKGYWPERGQAINQVNYITSLLAGLQRCWNGSSSNLPMTSPHSRVWGKPLLSAAWNCLQNLLGAWLLKCQRGLWWSEKDLYLECPERRGLGWIELSAAIVESGSRHWWVRKGLFVVLRWLSVFHPRECGQKQNSRIYQQRYVNDWATLISKETTLLCYLSIAM